MPFSSEKRRITMCNKNIHFYHSTICLSMYHLCIGWSIPAVFIIILVAATLEQRDIKALLSRNGFLFSVGFCYNILVMKHQKYKSFFCFWVSVWRCSCCLDVIYYFILDQTTYFGCGNRGSLLCSDSHAYNIFKQRMMPIHELFGVNFKTKIMWLSQQKWFVTL